MSLPVWEILLGDALEQLATLETNSVDCIVTSPPYWGLRDYDAAGQIGLEATIAEHLAAITAVFTECRRVLHHRGTLWLNYGDTYAGTNRGGQGEKSGITSTRSAGASRDAQEAHPDRVEPLRYKAKIGMPWRVAFALMDAGWMLRQEIIWHKPNPMPESCRDRPTTAHEPVFLFSQSRRYFYDREAAREPVTGGAHRRRKDKRRPTGWDGRKGSHHDRRGRYDPKSHGDFSDSTPELVDDRNWRTVWTIYPDQFRGEHFATMPVELAGRCIVAGTKPGGTVLDPFAGAGTTLLAALERSRNAVGIELKPEYRELARERIRERMGLLAAEVKR